MASRRRRGRDAIDEEFDDVLDDAVDKDALDEEALDETVADEDLDADLDGTDLDDTELDESEADEDLVEVPAGRRRRARAARAESRSKPPAKGAGGKLDGKARTKVDTDQLGVFGRLGRFVREVVAELRKVIWPTRKELLTYTAVLVVFVTVMITIVASLDAGFAWLTLHVLGGK